MAGDDYANAPGGISLRNELQGLREQAVPTVQTSAIINQVENGFIVNIGCKTFVAHSWTEINEGLELYFKDVSAAIKKYCRGGKV